jgi:hypothetical protein
VSGVTAPARGPAYDAFLSYRSTSVAAAKRVRKALLNLARRHHAEEFRVFLDTSSLLVGSLTDEITEALDASLHLVVLLAADTERSVWVAREIDHWLTHGGSPERLFLVRLDAVTDLTWDEPQRSFVHPQAVPAPLRTVFTEEQKYVDLAGVEISEAALAPLYAALVGVDTSALLLEEAEYQQRRRRIVLGASGVMAVLLVFAVVFGILALINRNEANHQRDAAVRSATRARAEADASAALLAVSSSYPEAIANVLAAAGEDATANVRSAMLSVEAATGRLVGAFDATDHGVDLDDAVLDKTGHVYLSWGPAGTSATQVQVRNLDSRRVLLDARLALPGVTAMRVVSLHRLVACTTTGVELVDLGVGTPAVRTAGPDGSGCTVSQLDDGSAITTITTATGPVAVYTPTYGDPTVAAGVGTVAAGSDAALVSGPAGTWLMSPGDVRQLSSRPADGTGWGDSSGHVFLRLSTHRWAMASRDDGWRLRSLPVPRDAVDASPLDEFGTFTGQVGWVTEAGIVGWSGDSSTVRLDDATVFTEEDNAWRTRLVSFDTGALLAVRNDTATLLTVPGNPPDNASSWNRLDNGWDAKLQGLVAPDSAGTDALAATCAPGQDQVELEGDLLVDSRGDIRFLSNVIGYGPGCAVIEGSDRLTMVGGGFSIDQAQTILPAYTGQQVQVFSETVNGGTRAVIVGAGSPHQVVSIGDEVVGPWGRAQDTAGPYTALGERRVAVASGALRVGNDDRLLLVGPTSTTQSAAGLPDGSTVLAPRPDGLGTVTGVAPFPGSSPVRQVADAKGATALSSRCDGLAVSYLPEADFATSVAAAEAQVPAAQVDGSWVDCRAGSSARVTQQAIASYGIGARYGLILATPPSGGLSIVSWSRGDHTPAVMAAPGRETSPERLGVSPDARSAVTVDRGRLVQVWARRDERWVATTSFVTSIGDPTAVALTDNSSLVLVVAGNGTFELLDTTSGRRLVTNLDPIETTDPVRSVSTTIHDGYLYAYLDLGPSSTPDVIDIPISIPVLRNLLCQAYVAPSCPGATSPG